jgi:hypothetical protein
MGWHVMRDHRSGVDDAVVADSQAGHDDRALTNHAAISDRGVDKHAPREIVRQDCRMGRYYAIFTDMHTARPGAVEQGGRMNNSPITDFGMPNATEDDEFELTPKPGER